ncbi:uncharacterized protein A4U43_C06F13320 [Asparagus officinalis]|uniref:Uncharacterized protein n=1 Tax=Asparagus officinalis TaxID=4686 RepID=A0A5P1ELM8_ASPOF|nr:uncharacterized protein A4U43_C06F13320 [Asparagus officinalis]
MALQEEFCELKKLGGGIYLFTFVGNLCHWFKPASIQSISKCIDKVSNDDEATALVTTNEGKFFSNGMDVRYLRGVSKDEAKEYLLMFQRLTSKLLTLCVPTIAVIRRRFDGQSAAQSGLIHDTCSSDERLLEQGIDKAKEYKSRNWKREVYHALKMEMFKSTVWELEKGGIGYARM